MLVSGEGVAQETVGSGGEVARLAPASFPELERGLNALLASPQLGSTRVGIHAVDVHTGDVLYARNADTLLNPASNIKLITGAAVLDVLGPNFTFTTTLLATTVEANTVKGGLYVRGDGEAFLLFADILSWAGELRKTGVSKIEGDIIIDDSIFDGHYLPPGFDQKNTDASYRPPIGAVSVNFNAITAVVTPGVSGQPASVRLDPPNAHITVVNRARTAAGTRSRVNVSAASNGDATVVTIAGTIGDKAGPVSIRKRIDNPPLFAGSVLASALEMVGIEFGGEVRTGRAPAEAKVLVSHRSQPLANVVSAMNKWSNNFIAEQLLRVLGTRSGEPSTWAAALAQATSFMERAGIPAGTYSLLNGSGLYDGNMVSPRQFTHLLRYMRQHRYAPEFLSSLAISGVDGTLQSRLNSPHLRGTLRGKTGTLNEVTALSGYLQTRSGRTVAFAIIFNDTPTGAWNFRNMQDAIATQIADVEK